MQSPSCGSVERVPKKMNGTWVFAGSRVSVAALFNNLEASATVHEFVGRFPELPREQAFAVLLHAEWRLLAAS